MACPFLLVGFDPRQVGALPRRPRLPSSRATGAAFFAEIVHRTISDRSSPPGQARFRASPRQARSDYHRQAWGRPLACGLKPSGNRTVKTLHRSVFSQSSARAVSSLAARFPAPGYADTCATQECDAMFPPILIMLWRRSPGAGTGPGGTCGTGRKGRALRPPKTRAIPARSPQQASGDCPGGRVSRERVSGTTGAAGPCRPAPPGTGTAWGEEGMKPSGGWFSRRRRRRCGRFPRGGCSSPGC
jgi:hypothetical protein